jgi:flagellar M-ring protein FliF
MNFLNNAIAQVSELFRSMTPGARITAGLLLTVVIVSVGYLFRQGTAGPDAFLFGGAAYSDGQLARMEAAISQANISGWAREGNRLRVPAAQQTAAIAAIADAGALPPNFNTILEDAIGKSTAFETRDQSQARMKDARQRQLSEIIRAMSWVEDAVVIVDEQDSKGFSRQRQITASVSVKPAAGEELDPMRASTLKRTIASSVAGLSPNAVTVTNLGGGSGFAAGSIYPEMFDEPYYKARVAFEQSKRESILRVLSYIPGVLVEVNAELDDTSSETSTTSKRDPKNVAAIRTTESKEQVSQAVADNGGRPGAEANSAAGPSQAAQVAAQNKNTNDNSMETVESVAGEETQVLTRAPFTPKEVLATVAVPTSYLEEVWKSRNRDAKEPPKPEDLTPIKSEIFGNIEKAVEPLIVKTADRLRDTFKGVEVVALDTLPQPTIEPPSAASMALAWTGRYWNTLAMLGVAVFSLMVMRSVVKSAPSSPASPSAAAEAAHAPGLTLTTEEPKPHAEAENANDAPQRPRLRLKKGLSVKDDLIEIVREDPDAAADILRSWIGKAG